MDIMVMVQSSREACAIEMPDYVVVTGGAHDTLNKVSVYSEQGWERDLPNLIWGRAEHACGHYIQNDIVVSATCQKVILGYVLQQPPCACGQVYLVVGGGGGTPHRLLDTTEILHEGGDSWAEVGSLPQPLIALKSVSINNEIIATGDNDPMIQ